MKVTFGGYNEGLVAEIANQRAFSGNQIKWHSLSDRSRWSLDYKAVYLGD